MRHPGLINSFSNNSEIFNWSEENFLKVRKIIDKYPSGKQQSAVIPVLDLAQRQNKGFLTKNIIERVAETLNMSFIRVMEIASFYLTGTIADQVCPKKNLLHQTRLQTKKW